MQFKNRDRIRTKNFSLKIILNNFYKLILPITFIFLVLGFIFSLGKIGKISNFNFILKPEIILTTTSGHKIYTELATNTLQRELGLSGKEKLKVYSQFNGNQNSDKQNKRQDREWDKKIITEGMLFVFEKPQILKFWMKDMKFDLDIIFLNDSDIEVVEDQNENEIANNLIQLDKNSKNNLQILQIYKNVKANSYFKKNNHNVYDPEIISNDTSNQDQLSQYVLEINAGLSEQMNLKVGDILSQTNLSDFK